MALSCITPALFATDVAEALVAAGTPVREAHRRVGELLMGLETEGRTLADLTVGEWSALGLPGGPSPASVRTQADALARMLDARPSRGHPGGAP